MKTGKNRGVYKDYDRFELRKEEILKEDRRAAGVGGRLRFVRVKGKQHRREEEDERCKGRKGLGLAGALGHTDTASRSLARSLLLSLAIRPDL